MNWSMNELKNEWIKEWMNWRMDEDELMNEWIRGWIDEWMNWRMDEDEFMNEWIEGWTRMNWWMNELNNHKTEETPPRVKLQSNQGHHIFPNPLISKSVCHQFSCLSNKVKQILIYEFNQRPLAFPYFNWNY